MRVLVTGGTGFIGSSVVELLLGGGHSVLMLSRRRELPEGLRGKDIEIIPGDLKDSSTIIRALGKADLFYHMGEIKNTTEAAALNNVKLIEDLTSAMSGEDIKRLVFISSISVAGIPPVVPAYEDTKPEIVLEDHYTSYKRRCEELISRTISGRYAIIRPPLVYGPGSRYLGGLINAVEKFGPIGFPFIGSGRNIASLIYIRDLARAIYLAGLLPKAQGQVFNLTDGLDHSWFDFLNTIAEFMGKKLRIMPIPPLLLKIPALPFDILSGLLGIKLDPVQYVNYFSRDLFFDNSKARTLLRWQVEYSLSDGVKEMVKFHRGL